MILRMLAVKSYSNIGSCLTTEIVELGKYLDRLGTPGTLNEYQVQTDWVMGLASSSSEKKKKIEKEMKKKKNNKKEETNQRKLKEEKRRKINKI